MALKEFKLPDIGEGIAEGEIVRWLVKQGDQVKEEQDFVEVMTDKATVMITVPYSGVIKELRAKEGQVVPVESVIAVIDVGASAGGGAGGDEKAPPASARQEPPAKPQPAPARQETPAKPQPAPARQEAPAKPQPPRAEPTKVVPAATRPAPAIPPAATGARAGTAGPAGSATPTEAPASVAPKVARAAPPQFEQASPGKVLAAPATRRRAREMGIDLGAVTGTGPSGRVTNDDLAQFTGSDAGAEDRSAAETETETETTAAPQVKAAATPRAPIAVAPPPAGAREERTPFRGLRRKIADAMSRSKHTVAHFTYVDDLDVTELVQLRKQAKELYAPQGVNITYLPFIMKAAVEAMKQFPAMNSSLDETTQELVIKRYYNFGIATDTDNGLIVPVVKDVDQKTIAQLARDIQELAERTRQGKVGVDDLKGGTFTITNAGNIGGLFATPIVNFPEVAILGVHAIKRTPIVRGDQIVIGDKMYLSVSIDHRIVDGATGARWMNVMKECLEVPQRLLLGSL